MIMAFSRLEGSQSEHSSNSGTEPYELQYVFGFRILVFEKMSPDIGCYINEVSSNKDHNVGFYDVAQANDC